MRRDPLTRDEAEQWLTEFLHSYFGVARARIVPGANLAADLDLDSIDAADIVLQFNRRSAAGSTCATSAAYARSRMRWRPRSLSRSDLGRARRRYP